MSTTLRVLGIDIGFASVGIALVELTHVSESVEWLDVIRTEKSAKKREVRASDDNLRRAQEIASRLVPFFQNDRIQVVCMEAMSFPRNASASMKMGMCLGDIATLACLYSVPIQQVSPQEIKKRLCGKKDASKDDVEKALRKRYKIRKDVVAFTESSREHAFDALASIVACLDSEVIRIGRKMIGAPKNGIARHP